MAVTLRALPAGINLIDPDQLVKVLRGILDDLEDQLNQRAQVYTTGGNIPVKLTKYDTVITANSNNIGLSVFLGKSFVNLAASMIGGLSAHNTNFLGYLQDAGPPTTVQFPNPGDWGFFLDITGPTYYIAFNPLGTTVLKRSLV